MTIASSDPDAQKIENLRAFFDGEEPERTQSDLSVGVSDEQYLARKAAEGEALLAEFDQLMADDEDDEIDELVLGDPDGGLDDFDDAKEATEPTCERIDDLPVLTPYDKARQRLTGAEILRDVAIPGSDEYHEAMAEMAAAKRALKVELERATDDGWRKRRATDEWRAGEGREEYNASRRKVRDKPNVMTPKDVLDAMTPEERELHRKDKNAEKVWRYGRRKAGWSEERIEAGLPGWWERRLSRRDCD
jgi:hypothetical protein